VPGVAQLFSVHDITAFEGMVGRFAVDLRDGVYAALGGA